MQFNMAFPINSVAGGGPYKIGPKTRQWHERVRQREAFKKGMKRMKDEEKAGRSKL